MIRPVSASDVASITDIYNHYVTHTVATFEEEIVSLEDMSHRIEAVKSYGLPWYVAEDQGKVIGYAYASRWHTRSAFRYSVEVTVYLAPETSAKGWGSQLYKLLFEELRQRSVHTVIAAISLPNEASIALHEKFGMESVGHFKEVGFKFKRWIDVGYWQGVL